MFRNLEEGNEEESVRATMEVLASVYGKYCVEPVQAKEEDIENLVQNTYEPGEDVDRKQFVRVLKERL